MELADLVRQAADSARRFTLDARPFFALSLLAVVGDLTEERLLAVPPLSAYPGYHRMTAGFLYAAGYRVWATFRRTEHFDVELLDGEDSTVARFLAVAGPVIDNEHFLA